jgi:elongation factor P
LRKGLRIQIEGSPYLITEFNFVKPGKGAAIYNCKLKNLINGSTLVRGFRSNDSFDEPRLDEKTLIYSYVNGDHYIFNDKNYEEITISAEVLGDNRHFLQPDMEVHILFFNDIPIDIVLPTFVEMKITYTEPGARGDTANNVLKAATLEGGYQIQVPIFVKQDDVIKIDTRTGEYCDRVGRK